MSLKILKFFLRFSVILIAISEVNSVHHQNFSLLIDFTCATAKDELEKHPEMRTIAMVELENNFPLEFSREVLKCLPVDVAKVIINPHTILYRNNHTVFGSKETMAIYVADVVTLKQTFHEFFHFFYINFPPVHHLSKHLIISSDRTKINDTQKVFKKLLNVVQIYEENHKVISRSFDMTRNLTTFETFENLKRENLSQILFADKTKNLNGQTFYIVWNNQIDIVLSNRATRIPTIKWSYYLEILAERLNATLNFYEIKPNNASYDTYQKGHILKMRELVMIEKFDFHLNFIHRFVMGRLSSYNNEDWCYLAPLPNPFSITELILFLPMDKSCWMWLGITIAVSTLIWRISEGHWHFPFGAFSYFMGQAQLSVRIRTNRLTMKILLQLLIFAIFIFSNGYQSIITSFMLNPMQQKLLKTIDEVLDSDLNIRFDIHLNEVFKDNLKYQTAFNDGRVIKRIKNSQLKDITEGIYLFEQPCKLYKIKIERAFEEEVDELYQVPEPVYSLSRDLFTHPLHPYLDKFQELMDRTFEAGLHQAWERFYWEAYLEVNYNGKKLESEKEILEFEEIIPFFLILSFGFGVALLALSCEIFWKDFVSELTKEYMLNKLRQIFGTEIRRA